MFSHIMLGADDMTASKTFYVAVLGVLGTPAGFSDDRGRVVYATDKGVLMLTTPINGEPASCANGGTVGFAAKSAADVDAWHAAGLAHGGTACENPPGIREGAVGSLYLAYMRDPSGNKLCALHRVKA
jgi:catechol 2,3-dioxygenase-like lactoylglutathione lyase family enzyme